MTDKKQYTFAIFGCRQNKISNIAITAIEEYLKKQGARILYGIKEIKDRDKIDFAISVGGDGTLLKTAGNLAKNNIPILGVNTGRLGFLADISPKCINDAIESIYTGEYKIEERVILEVKASPEFINYPYAVNDVAILKRDNASMIKIKATVDGEDLITYQADGLIISTPSGSTAYNLSNGGPIIAPGTNNICLTAVAPHSLNVRPIVLSDDTEIGIKVESRSKNYLVAIDGNSINLSQNTVLTIKKSRYKTYLIRYKGHSYFSTLREKIMWGQDMRIN